jgi:hypothetical protein
MAEVISSIYPLPLLKSAALLLQNGGIYCSTPTYFTLCLSAAYPFILADYIPNIRRHAVLKMAELLFLFIFYNYPPSIVLKGSSSSKVAEIHILSYVLKWRNLLLLSTLCYPLFIKYIPSPFRRLFAPDYLAEYRLRNGAILFPSTFLYFTIWPSPPIEPIAL